MTGGAFHEDLSRQAEVRASSDRAFGLVVAAFFLLIGVWPLKTGASARVWALVIASIFLAVALAFPSSLARLNRWWLGLGVLLQRVVSPVVLGVIFYLTVAPIGVLMRVLGKRPLRLGFDPAAPSYWIERRPPGPAPHTMPNQF